MSKDRKITMSISSIIITISKYVIVVSITDLMVCLLMLSIFYVSRTVVFQKFNIHLSFKKDRLFWVINKLIFLVLLIGLFIISTDITSNTAGVHYGFTVQFV